MSLGCPYYYWSYDNPKGGDYRKAPRQLAKVADVERTAPKTTFRLRKRVGVTFPQLRVGLADTLDERKGCGILFSSKTGHVYVLDNRGNRRGVWVRQ